MLPQPDASILTTNPGFCNIWKDLSIKKLDWNGVSKPTSTNKEVVEMKEALEKKRVHLGQKHVLAEALRCVGYGDFTGREGLGNELQETVQIVSAQLDGKLDVADKDIVEVEIEEFVRNIQVIVSAMEEHMGQNVQLICQMLDGSGGTSATSLSAQVQELKTSIDEGKWMLGMQRVELAERLTQVLVTNGQVLQTAIRRLEQVIHGSVGRYTRAQAEHLATVAAGIEKRLLVVQKQVLGQVYGSSEQIEEQLLSKREEVESQMAMLRRRLRDRQDRLEELDRVRGLAGAVDELRRMRDETARVRDEVERLQGRG